VRRPGARLTIEDGRCWRGVGDVYATTSTFNVRSEAVMRRLGMRRRPDLDYLDPRFPTWVGAPHIVYELARASGGSITPDD
jgi:RimJ/RimL family protein N-acetyltransferase